MLSPPQAVYVLDLTMGRPEKASPFGYRGIETGREGGKAEVWRDGMVSRHVSVGRDWSEYGSGNSWEIVTKRLDTGREAHKDRFVTFVIPSVMVVLAPHYVTLKSRVTRTSTPSNNKIKQRNRRGMCIASLNMLTYMVVLP